MPRTWDWGGVMEMLSPDGRVRVIWDQIWKGNTVHIILDQPDIENKVEYILFRRGRCVFAGPCGAREQDLDRWDDDDPGVLQMLRDAIEQGARFKAQDGPVLIQL